MTDLSHLDALRARLSNESARLEKAVSYKCSQGEYISRLTTVRGIEKEIAGELEFLGLNQRIDGAIDALDDDTLLAQLSA